MMLLENGLSSLEKNFTHSNQNNLVHNLKVKLYKHEFNKNQQPLSLLPTFSD